MTPEEKAAYINAQAACALIEAMGMQAENKQREVEDKSPAFTHEAFMSLQTSYGIDHNSSLTYLGE